MFEMLEEELQAKLHIFSTFFYTRLSNGSMDNKALR
jgi:Ulp1 family protease